jgi:dTDP-4-amino-4,6-dideoxygalactose transaminase
MTKIPLLKPKLPDANQLLPFLRRIDQARWYTNFGPLENEFLQKLLEIQSETDTHQIHGTLTSNATQGLELVLSALDLAPNSKVAIPALTFAATATAVRRAGHIPIALDVDRDSWLLTPEGVPTKGELLIDAVVPVSTFGMPQDATAWSQWSHSNQVPVVIDAAAAFGAQKSAPDITVVFSLHATKTLSSVEGGLVITQNPALAHRLRAMTNFGFGLMQATASTNAKMSEYHAAVGLAHLELWPSQVQSRRNLLLNYEKGMALLTGKFLKLQKDTGHFAPSMMNVKLHSAEARARLEKDCTAAGIQTRRWYQPLVHNLSSIEEIVVSGPLKESEKLSQTLIGLPFFPEMTIEELNYILNVCTKSLQPSPSEIKDY